MDIQGVIRTYREGPKAGGPGGSADGGRGARSAHTPVKRTRGALMFLLTWMLPVGAPICITFLDVNAIGAKTAPQTASATVGSWNLATDRLDTNLRTGNFNAPDHVSMARSDGSTIDADRAKGNYRKKVATLSGNVKIYDVHGTFGLRSAGAVQRGPATLQADELRVDDVTRLYDASGRVHYAQGNASVDADRAHLDDAANRLDLYGKVHVIQGDRTLDCDHATYDTLTGDGQADGNVAIAFPGIKPSIATPKPIIIKPPKIPHP